MKKLSGLAARLAVLLVALSQAASLLAGTFPPVIDDFSTPQGPLSVVEFDFDGNTETDSMLGGERDQFAQAFAVDGLITTEVTGGVWNMDFSPPIGFAEVSQIYDGLDDNAFDDERNGLSPPGGIDLTGGGANDRFRVHVDGNPKPLPSFVGLQMSSSFLAPRRARFKSRA